MFSKTCEYALKIMIHLASIEKSGQLFGLKDISSALDSPEAFTAKILQQLVKSGLLQSVRGPSGGFGLRKNRPIYLIEIVHAIDGAGITRNCVLGLESCSDNHPCPVHDKFLAVRNHLTGVLDSTNLDDVKGGVIQGNRYLKL